MKINVSFKHFGQEAVYSCFKKRKKRFAMRNSSPIFSEMEDIEGFLKHHTTHCRHFYGSQYYTL